MTLAVFVKRSIKKNVRGVREDGGNWWKGGGVGEAVLGGDGEEAADPCRVTLNLPCDAGEISNISLAVMACSASQPVDLEALSTVHSPNPLDPACIRDTRVKLLSYTVELIISTHRHGV